jgi:hypothetical protein
LRIRFSVYQKKKFQRKGTMRRRDKALPFFKFFSSDNLLAIFFSLASKAEE